jgi:hypothetical protein
MMATSLGKSGDVSEATVMIGESVPAGEGRIALDVVRYTAMATRWNMD